jgi:hypothetical protein
MALTIVLEVTFSTFHMASARQLQLPQQVRMDMVFPYKRFLQAEPLS